MEELRKKQNMEDFFDYLRKGIKSALIEVQKFIGKEGIHALVNTTMNIK